MPKSAAEAAATTVDAAVAGGVEPLLQLPLLLGDGVAFGIRVNRKYPAQNDM